MNALRVLALSLAVLAAAGGCAASHDETWIGKNVGVTVGSEEPPQRADR